MKAPILITAAGTSPVAMQTYRYLQETIGNCLPEQELIWCFSTRSSTRKRQDVPTPAVLSPEDAVQRLCAQGVGRAVVQPLFLLPGSEFHDMQHRFRDTALVLTTGMPLFSSPGDYQELAEILRPTIEARPDKAILLLGHGTGHPSWTAYYALEKIFRCIFGDKIFVGVLEKYPDSQSLPSEIKAAGFSEVCIIPFLLIAGMHYHRDIVGEHPDSWTNRLRKNHLSVEAIGHGLGLFPGLERLIARHITEALAAFAENRKSWQDTAPWPPPARR